MTPEICCEALALQGPHFEVKYLGLLHINWIVWPSPVQFRSHFGPLTRVRHFSKIPSYRSYHSILCWKYDLRHIIWMVWPSPSPFLKPFLNYMAWEKLENLMREWTTQTNCLMRFWGFIQVMWTQPYFILWAEVDFCIEASTNGNKSTLSKINHLYLKMAAFVELPSNQNTGHKGCSWVSNRRYGYHLIIHPFFPSFSLFTIRKVTWS